MGSVQFAELLNAVELSYAQQGGGWAVLGSNQ